MERLQPEHKLAIVSSVFVLAGLGAVGFMTAPLFSSRVDTPERAALMSLTPTKEVATTEDIAVSEANTPEVNVEVTAKDEASPAFAAITLDSLKETYGWASAPYSDAINWFIANYPEHFSDTQMVSSFQTLQLAASKSDEDPNVGLTRLYVMGLRFPDKAAYWDQVVSKANS